MCSHLLKILESNVIEHFLQNLNNGVPQKVLSLAVIKAKEAESARTRRISATREKYLIRQCFHDNFLEQIVGGNTVARHSATYARNCSRKTIVEYAIIII